MSAYSADDLRQIAREMPDYKLCITDTLTRDGLKRILIAVADQLESQQSDTAHLRARERQAFEEGFDAGFEESGEGWNGEYPPAFKPEQRARYDTVKAESLAAYLAKDGAPHSEQE